MSEALAELIKQAEIQQIEAKMALRYRQNLELFKQRFPAAYKKLKDWKPEQWLLKLDPNNQINLIDPEQRKWLYNDIPSEYGKKLVSAFKEKTQLRKFRVVQSKEQNPKHFHIRNLNTLLGEYESKQFEHVSGTPAYLTNLIVSGIGLGHHLLELVEQFDIQNILIYENSLDAVHASLHIIDWQVVVDAFSTGERTISICVGTDANGGLTQIEHAIQNLGLHSQMFTFVLRHADRECENTFIETYMKQIRAFIGGLGYFDDERIGFAHAYHNLKAQHAIYVSRTRQARDMRAIVIGNGPSLDMHEHYLKANKDKALLVSCGTALGTLVKMGIKPDFHVEMERPTFVKDAINLGSTQEQRQGITLLGLHTVSPETIACFEEACLAIKPNDGGSELVTDFLGNETPSMLPFCNPTVTNCALSYLCAMGFEDIHLVGVDLGAPNNEEHHSEKSVYSHWNKYETKEEVESRKMDVTCDGNFGGKVVATPVLNMSRVGMERLLDLMVTALPTFKCYNTNLGAKIKGTVSVTLEELDAPREIDKQTEIQKLKAHCFYKPNTDCLDEQTAKQKLAFFKQVKDKVKLPETVSSEQELMQAMTRAFTSIAKDETTRYLLRGTMSCFFGAIVQYSCYMKHNKDFRSQAHKGIQEYNACIDNIYHFVEEHMLDIDDTRSILLDRVMADIPEEQKA